MARPVARRNPRIGPPDATEVSASDAKNGFGSILDRVARGGTVAITRHDRPVAMLISIEAYRALAPAPEEALKNLAAEFDAMYERMQLPGAAEAMQRAFAMTPAELGRAAVAQATGSRQRQPKPKRQRRGPQG
jgi:prevent-host-death family protein